MRNERKRYTPEQKVAILRRHHLEHVPVSHVCEEHQVHPTVFYRWQKGFFENRAAGFRQDGKAATRRQEAEAGQIAALQGKLQRKNDVLAELMEEHVA